MERAVLDATVRSYLIRQRVAFSDHRENFVPLPVDGALQTHDIRVNRAVAETSNAWGSSVA
jgi:hypothetical protein